MVSNTEYTRRRRKLRKKNAGKARKRELKKKGTTPAFPLDPPQ